MADYDNKTFTEKVLKVYADTLQQRLPRVKFMMDDRNAVGDAVRQKVFRLVRGFGDWSVSFPLDQHMRRDGSIDQEILAEAVAGGLSEPVIVAAQEELQSEEDDPSKRVGAGQLWLLHKNIPLTFTLGGAQVHFASDGKIGVFGQTWYDQKSLKNMFEAKTGWGLARSGEVKKEPLDLDTLQRGDPPM